MDGVINIYKPKGVTSFQVVKAVTKLVGIKKVGHTGTLDPAATGVLPVCIGKATKLIDYIMDGRKLYRVEMTLGIVTDTYDGEGTILEEHDVNLSKDEIIKAILSFKGKSNQIPPMYSALKVNGKRLYDLARQGVTIERTPREIHIFNIDILSIDESKVIFDVECSKGTYIRSLCFDIGNLLHCGAMMSGLERRASGKFIAGNSVNIDELCIDNISEYIIKMDDVIDNLEILNVDEKFEKLLRNGVEIKDKYFLNLISNDTKYRVYNNNKQLIGIGEKFADKFKLLTLLI